MDANNDTVMTLSAYGELFLIRCPEVKIRERLRRFFAPSPPKTPHGPSSLFRLEMEFRESSYPTPAIEFGEFRDTVFEDRFVMLWNDHPCVEIGKDMSKAIIRYDPRWPRTSPGVVDTFLIEAPLLVLLSWYSMPYVHGAAISRENRGFVLIGEQGTGKSTLAYAASRLGCSFIAEDYVFVRDTGDILTLHGQPNTLKLCKEAATFYPDIDRLPRIVQPNGEEKIDVLPTLEPKLLATEADLAGVILLSRDRDAERNRPGPEEIYSSITGDLVFDPEGLASRHEEAYRKVAGLLVGVLPMTDEPAKRARLVMEMIDR